MVGEGKVDIFPVMLGHPTLYWASLVKRQCPTSPQTTNLPNHQESINVRIHGELFFPQSVRDVLRFRYEIGKKQLRIFPGFGWIRSGCRIHYDVQ